MYFFGLEILDSKPRKFKSRTPDFDGKAHSGIVGGSAVGCYRTSQWFKFSNIRQKWIDFGLLTNIVI